MLKQYMIAVALASMVTTSIAAPVPHRANCGTGYSPRDCKEGETPGSIAWPWTPEAPANADAWRLFRASATPEQTPEYIATFDGSQAGDNGRLCQRVARTMTDQSAEYWCEPGPGK